MNAEIHTNRDFWAGVMLIATGVASVFIARTYPFGTAFRMGPGYFPSILGGILIVFGLSLLVRGLRSTDKIVGGWSLRALIVLPLSFVLFGWLMDHAGFVPALVVLIFGSALGSREFKLVEVLLLTAIVTLMSVGIFIWLLGLPYPLIVGY